MVIARESWTNYVPEHPNPPLAKPVSTFVIHHSASVNHDDHAHLNSILQESLHRGFNDFMYNYAMGHNGDIYMGRLPPVLGSLPIGAATKDWNSRSISICVMGNFEVETASEPQWREVARLIWFLREKGFLSKTAAIIGHRDTKPTACPGANYYPLLPFIAVQASLYEKSGGLDVSPASPTPTP